MNSYNILTHYIEQKKLDTKDYFFIKNSEQANWIYGIRSKKNGHFSGEVVTEKGVKRAFGVLFSLCIESSADVISVSSLCENSKYFMYSSMSMVRCNKMYS